MPPAGRIRPYKDFLTPVLHRRFVTAMALIGILCYVEAMAIGEYTSFFGYILRTGIRAGIFFISALSVFVLRVAQLHVGFRTSNSAFQTFKQYALRPQNLMTFGWYFFSAWLFGETYIFSTPESAHIKWITTGTGFDRPRLNERPIYLISYFCILSILQAAIHLYYDYDRIDMPVTKTKPESSSDQRSHLTIPPKTQVSDKAPALFKSALQRAAVMTIVTPPIYWMFVRRQAWSWTLMVAKVFWSLPKSTALPTIAPFHFRVLFRSLTGGTLLILLWEVSNAAFSAYVAQEPLKNERPITHESRDPNGSLLTGLKGKKLQTRAFAFWELVYIAQRFQGRRKLIFEDIDRIGGSAWAQILAVCLEVINGISERITQYQTPPPGDASAAKPPDESQALPRLAQPPKDDNIFASSPPAVSRRAGAAQAVSTFAKDRGHSAPLGLTKSAREFVNDPMVQDTIFPGGFEAMFRYYGTLILRSPIGWIFRQEYRRRIAAIVLGTPYGDVGIIVDAIDAVTRLAVCSLTEDKYGNVQRDVKLIVRTLTTTINKLEAFRDSFAPHWTDVEQKKESPETDKILAGLKGGLNDLLEAFGDYSEDLRLSQSEMRNARSAATPARERQTEMRETR